MFYINPLFRKPVIAICLILCPASSFAGLTWKKIPIDSNLQATTVFAGDDGLIGVAGLNFAGTADDPNSSGNYEMMLSTDSGKSFKTVFSRANQSSLPVDMSPVNVTYGPYLSNNVFFVAYNCQGISLCLARSTDKGNTWSDNVSGTSNIFRVYRDERDVSLNTFVGLANSEIFESTDRGLTWHATMTLATDHYAGGAYSNGSVYLYTFDANRNTKLTAYQDNGRTQLGQILPPNQNDSFENPYFLSTQGFLGLLTSDHSSMLYDTNHKLFIDGDFQAKNNQNIGGGPRVMGLSTDGKTIVVETGCLPTDPSEQCMSSTSFYTSTDGGKTWLSTDANLNVSQFLLLSNGHYLVPGDGYLLLSQ